MSPRGGPPSQLPTLTEVWADPSSADFENSTSSLRRLDSVPGALAGVTPAAPLATPALAPLPATGRGPGLPTADPGALAAEAAPDPLAANPPPAQARVLRTGTLRLRTTPQVPPAVASGAEALLVPAGQAGAVPADPGPEPAPDDLPGPGDDQLVRAVLQDLQRHVDLMLEYRLRASLTPVLTQLADNLVRELRQELSATLRDVVKRSVNQELVRRRKR